MRQAIPIILALAVLAIAPTAASQQPGLSCPNGFEAYALPQSEAELRQFSRINAGLDAPAPPYTVAELIDLAQAIDENNDGIFCLKAVSNLRGASVNQWGFFYGARDNDTAAA